MDEKNLFKTSPASSPLKKMRLWAGDQNKSSNNEKSLTLISLPPIFTGFARTLKSITNCGNEDNLMAGETDNEISIIASTMITSNVQAKGNCV